MKNKTNIHKTVILNLIQDLQRLPFQCKRNDNNMRGRFQIKFGMTSLLNNGGFTLIELLVVVLIIGILAAVALPQYQKAVYKAKLARLIPLATSLYQAEEAYYLEHGEYTGKISALDIDFSAPECTLTEGEISGYYSCPDHYIGVWDGPVNAQVGLSFTSGEQKKIAYLHYFATDENETYHKGDIVCFSRGEIARNICKSLGEGTESEHPTNWDYQYILTR